ncbi:MAG TPA: antitoxin family protein [Planctomycetia bacterium]|nr:antitoxin family protein [Planctomycetia bacterium]
MITTVTAVYRDGVLRPDRPLALAEGATVAITLTQPAPQVPPDKESDADAAIRKASTLQEWILAANQSPPEADEYDLLQALEENRGGERLLFPKETKGGSW